VEVCEDLVGFHPLQITSLDVCLCSLLIAKAVAHISQHAVASRSALNHPGLHSLVVALNDGFTVCAGNGGMLADVGHVSPH
jgi:hypothetical protein